MSKKSKPGDVVEIKTKRGLAYAQYALRKPRWGALIRVLPGFHNTRPDEFAVLVKQSERFVTFFPLQAAIDRQLFEIVAHEPVPASAHKLPLFRAAGHIDREGFIHDWWLWDGEKSWRIGKLNPEQRKLPIQEVVNDTLLIQRIEEEWTPEKQPLREPGTLRKLFGA
jgi:hypothetical protein